MYWLLLLSGCSPAPSETDIARLKLVETKHPGFEFTLKDEFYLKAKLRKEVPVSEDDLRDIYKMFFFDETNSRLRNTTFVYLNFYDSKGKFQYQVAFDSKKNAFVKSQSEYY